MVTPTFDAKKYVSDFERAFNEKDVQSVMHYYDPNVEISDPSGSGKTIRGLDTFRQFMESWARGFSDTKLEATQIVQSGKDVAILQRCQGRHTGEFEVVPGEKIGATNKTVNFEVAEFIKLNDQGKIVKDIGIMDQALLMRQLGLLPSTTPGQTSKSPVQR
jgi:predicted ester cyclase